MKVIVLRLNFTVEFSFYYIYNFIKGPEVIAEYESKAKPSAGTTASSKREKKPTPKVEPVKKKETPAKEKKEKKGRLKDSFCNFFIRTMTIM